MFGSFRPPAYKVRIHVIVIAHDSYNGTQLCRRVFSSMDAWILIKVSPYTLPA